MNKEFKVDRNQPNLYNPSVIMFKNFEMLHVYFENMIKVNNSATPNYKLNHYTEYFYCISANILFMQKNVLDDYKYIKISGIFNLLLLNKTNKDVLKVFNDVMKKYIDVSDKENIEDQYISWNNLDDFINCQLYGDILSNFITVTNDDKDIIRYIFHITNKCIQYTINSKYIGIL